MLLRAQFNQLLLPTAELMGLDSMGAQGGLGRTRDLGTER